MFFLIMKHLTYCLASVFKVAEPLRAMVMGAPLEDARHLTQRYDRMRQEAEAQVFEYIYWLSEYIFGSFLAKD